MKKKINKKSTVVSTPKHDESKLSEEGLKLFKYLKLLINNNPSITKTSKAVADLPKLIEILSMARYNDNESALKVRTVLESLKKDNSFYVISTIYNVLSDTK